MVTPLSAPGSIERRARRVREPAILAFILVAFMVWPIYLLPSGYPQLVSVALFFAFALVMVRYPRMSTLVQGSEVLVLLGMLVVYSLMVNLVTAISNGDARPLVYSAYYLQGYLGCVAFQHVVRTESSAVRLIAATVCISLVIQAGIAFASGLDLGSREAALFGNPNQLGLYGLLAIAFLGLIHSRYHASKVSFLFGLAFAMALILLSLSKAAIIAVLAMLILYAVLVPLTSRWAKALRPLFVLAGITGVLAFAALNYDRLLIVESVVDRLAAIGESGDDSIAGRGYGRLVEWPQYLVLGAGEGLYDRWNSRFEVHSMLGTLVFSYGVPGISIVLLLLAVVARRNARDFVVFFVPILLYSLTHNPLRQPMLWMLLLLIAHLSAPSARPDLGENRTHTLEPGLAILNPPVYMPPR